MRIARDLADAIGHTPLIRLNRVSDETGCEILGKAEFMNPGQSVKDRAALYIIRDAIARGDLKPGGTIVEGTAGNTGIGLALVGASMGFKTVIVIPETQSEEKKDMLRLAGAQLVQVPAAPYRNPNNFVRYSERLAKELAKTEQARAEYGKTAARVRDLRALMGLLHQHLISYWQIDSNKRWSIGALRLASKKKRNDGVHSKSMQLPNIWPIKRTFALLNCRMMLDCVITHENTFLLLQVP